MSTVARLCLRSERMRSDPYTPGGVVHIEQAIAAVTKHIGAGADGVELTASLSLPARRPPSPYALATSAANDPAAAATTPVVCWKRQESPREQLPFAMSLLTSVFIFRLRD